MNTPQAGNFDTQAIKDAMKMADKMIEEARSEPRSKWSMAKELLRWAFRWYAIAFASIAFAVTILTLPLKLVYVWACFLWNLIG